MKIETGDWLRCSCDIDHDEVKYKLSFDNTDVFLCKKCFKELKSIIG